MTSKKVRRLRGSNLDGDGRFMEARRALITARQYARANQSD